MCLPSGEKATELILSQQLFGRSYVVPPDTNPEAVKILRDAWLSPARRERFAAEQRMLAQLNHPSIARLYDANTLEDGTPWFVMEYVKGVPISAFCRIHEYSMKARLELFRAVCGAVQYAHGEAVKKPPSGDSRVRNSRFPVSLR